MLAGFMLTLSPMRYRCGCKKGKSSLPQPKGSNGGK